MTREQIDLKRVWRDKNLLDEIRAEIKKQSLEKWRPWEILLPPELLWPMINEINQGRIMEWSPVLDGVGINIGKENEVSIRFVLTEVNPSPVMVKTLKYKSFLMSKDIVKHGLEVRGKL